MKKKIRYPNALYITQKETELTAQMIYTKDQFYIGGQAWLKLKEAKRLHAWLTKAIKYIEQEKK